MSMSTTDEHKRRKYNDEENSDKKSSDSDSDESDESSGDGSCSASSTTFVAWLESADKGNGTQHIISIGELHFSNAEHIADASCLDDEEEEGDTYCVVCQLKLIPQEDEDEETPSVYTFKDSFPFRVLKSSSCIVGIPLMPIAADGDICDGYDGKILSEEDKPIDYVMDSELRPSLLEELQQLSQSNNNVSPYWKVSIPNDKVVIEGVNAWWRAGEGKTGWDLSKISEEDYTTLQTMHEEGKTGENDNNILMSLYKDLCAFQPLHITNNNLTRDTIEERFEWRTCLWYVVELCV